MTTDTRKGNLAEVRRGATRGTVRYGKVHARGVRLDASHVIPACQVQADRGWRLVFRGQFNAFDRRQPVGEVETTTRPVTCAACK